VSGTVGAGVSLSDESGSWPSVRIVSDSPIYAGTSALGRLRASLSLSALPGEAAFNLAQLSTYKSAEVSLEAQRRIGSGQAGHSTSVFARYAFATRLLPTDPAPRDRFARWWGAGIRADYRDAAGHVARSLGVMFGRSEVASPDAFGGGQLVFDGSVELAEFAGAKGVVRIEADAHLNVGRGATLAGQTRRDVMRVWVAVGL